MRRLLILILISIFSVTAWAGNWNSSIIRANQDSGFNEFERHGSGWNKYNHLFLENAGEARAGEKYQKVELRSGDCFPSQGWNDCRTDRNRAELKARQSQKPIGNQCYSLSIKLDPSFKAVYPTFNSLAQVHQRGGPKGQVFGSPSTPSIMMIVADRKKLQFKWNQTFGEKTDVKTKTVKRNMANIAEILGKWTDISWCLDFDNNEMKAWLNGKLVVHIEKPPVKWKPRNIYFKYGIYNSSVSTYEKVWGEPIPTLVVHYDEIRRGTSVEQVDSNINPSLNPVD